jgi:hypothetical protein
MEHQDFVRDPAEVNHPGQIELSSLHPIDVEMPGSRGGQDAMAG